MKRKSLQNVVNSNRSRENDAALERHFVGRSKDEEKEEEKRERQRARGVKGNRERVEGESCKGTQNYRSHNGVRHQ